MLEPDHKAAYIMGFSHACLPSKGVARFLYLHETVTGYYLCTRGHMQRWVLTWTWLRCIGWIEETDCSEVIDSDKIPSLVCYLENGNDVTIATDDNTMQAFMWYKTVVVVTATHSLQPSFPPSLLFPSFISFNPPTVPPSIRLPVPSLWPLCIPLSSHFTSLPQGSLERLLLRIHCPCKLSCSQRQPLILAVSSPSRW